jgi:dTDP-4-amino-4,6-dideoxygalactose transaminase
MKRQPKIPFNKPFVAGKELHHIARAVKVEAHLSGDGPFTRKCQAWLEEQIGCQKAFLTHSCTAALEMAAILACIGPGDEVIMPSFTFVSTANAFVLRGGVPVFVDIRPDTLNINEQLIEQAITPKTRAIVPVHYAGLGCEMDTILEIANEHNLLVIEDAAQALFSTYKGRSLGGFGQLGCLSFHETKNIISGEGGALLINDEELIQRAEIIREKGTNRSQFFRGEVDKYTWVDIGSSFLPSELTAAFLYAQFEEAERIIGKRCRIIDGYIDGLKRLEERGYIRLPATSTECDSNGHIFYIITRSPDERTQLMNHLQQRGIHAVFHYVPLHTSPAGIRYGRTSGELKETERLSDQLLRLPLYFSMSDEELHRVVREVTSFYEKRA